MNFVKEKAKKMAGEALLKWDNEAGETMPCFLRPFMMCNGGSAVRTMSCMSCVLPAEMKEQVTAMSEQYEEAKKKADGE